MVTRDGQFKVKIPTAYKKKKNVSIDGDIRKPCPTCGDKKSYIIYAKPQNISEHDPTLYHVSKCTRCQYIHLEPICQENNNNT